MKHYPRCQHTHFVKNGFVNAKPGRFKRKSISVSKSVEIVNLTIVATSISGTIIGIQKVIQNHLYE